MLCPKDVTLNQRVQGSSPCAPTKQINHLVESEPVREDAFYNRFVELVRLSFLSSFLQRSPRASRHAQDSAGQDPKSGGATRNTRASVASC
jgi:hypothetical protein